MLGAHVLGHLSPSEDGAVRAHLDGCATCRAELAEIATVVPLLGGVDPATFASPPTPPPDLGVRIRAAIAAESAGLRRTTPPARSRRRALVGLAAAAVLVAGVGVGALLGRTTAPEAPAAGPVPLEQIGLAEVGASPVDVRSAGLVPHTWGVELRMEAAGFVEGEVYRAAFRDDQGELQPAGQFLGTGSASLSCNLQAGVLREDVRAVVVRDGQGRTVLRSQL